MLLTITSTTPPATDLGYLLHKNPARVQTFELGFGNAHVFYPEATPERCTAALLLEVDPVRLVRGRTDMPDGPEYTTPKHLEQLRQRGLGRKRSLALREFALGVEALERFVRREPLHRVHECVFGVLALESEPVDPRL